MPIEICMTFSKCSRCSAEITSSRELKKLLYMIFFSELDAPNFKDFYSANPLSFSHSVAITAADIFSSTL